MTPEIYAKKKEELLGILTDILQIADLSATDRDFFERKKKKLQEDEFSISLIGEFQGGKSTTFDALCGGREVSPRGNNIKTSACKIKVTNISGNNEEHAKITWKTNAELVLTISKVLVSLNPEEIGYNPDEKKAYSITDYLDLSNPSHQALVRKAINEEWEKLSNNDSDTKDILIIAEFILKFYNETKDLRKVCDCSLKEASQMMVFPDDMITRFTNNGIKAFKPEESLFVFIQSVDCYIKSKTLERLGCTITDCPGLFASDYDTSVATQTIIDSDATLYLLSGEKMIGQGDKRAISEIVKIKTAGILKEDDTFRTALDNIFFAINQRKSDDETSFVNHDLTEINTLGFGKQELPMYNALLYYLAQFGNSYLKNQLDQHTITRFLDKGKKYGDNIERIWIRMVRRVLNNLDLDNDIEDLSEQSVASLLKSSKADTLFESIETSIIGKKAHSILIENGAKKVDEGLHSIEEELKRKEKAATTDVAVKAMEYKKAKDDFKAFEDGVKELLESSFSKETVIRPMIDDVYTRYFRNPEIIENISFHITKDLIEYIGKGSTKWKGFKDIVGKLFSDKLKKKMEDEITSEVKPFFGNAFKIHLTPILQNWLSLLEKGTDVSFKRLFVQELNDIANKIKTLWNTSVSSSPLLQTLNITTAPLEPQNMEVAKLDYKKFMSNDMAEDIAGLAVSDSLNEILHSVIGVCIGMIVAFVLDTFLTFGVALIVGGIIELLYIAGALERKEYKSKEDFNKKERNLYNAIYNILTDALGDMKNKEKICFSDEKKSLVAIPDSMAQAYRNFYLLELGAKRKELTDRISKEEEMYKGRKENLLNISTTAKKQRQDVIVPLRGRVEQFIKDIEK